MKTYDITFNARTVESGSECNPMLHHQSN